MVRVADPETDAWSVREEFRRKHNHVCKCGGGRTGQITTEYRIEESGHIYVYSNTEVIGLADAQMNVQ